jgi:hypothetical protein
MINNILPYRRKNISTLLVFSAAVVLMLLASPLSLFNILQPVQAQTTMSFKTPQPVISEDGSLVLTLDAQGTLTRNFSGYQPMSGTFQLNSTSEGSIKNSGDIERGRLSNNSEGVVLIVLVASDSSIIEIYCSTSDHNVITYEGLQFQGAVECNTGGDTTAQPSSSSSQGGGNTTTTHTAQPSSSLTGSSQGADRGSSSSSNSKDSDSDGIPDSSDKCTHNSNPRCFKEGDTRTTQQQPPSTTRTGNQTG